MTHIIDRRLNPKGKSLGNRQKFFRRAKEQIREAVKRSIQDKAIADIATGDKITIPTKGIGEPRFRQSSEGGYREGVLPGNDEHLRGDELPRPQKGGGGRGRQGSNSGDGEDEFSFTLSRDEFLDIFMEDLELPDLVKKKLKEVNSTKLQRAGYTTAGSPTALNVIQTMRNAMGRRLALKRPKSDEIKAIQAEIFALEAKVEKSCDEVETMLDLHQQLAALTQRQKKVPFIDPLDVRYNRFQEVPQPTTQAVMFCLMDVSASMGEHHKDLAKRFFMLLYLFLQRQYERIELVFIRHTHEAEEVDEETFFHDRKSGGTVVSTALEKMAEVIKDRYPVDDWNIYCAQASDGDNWSSDSGKCGAVLTEKLLPLIQYFAYVEISNPNDWFSSNATASDLWKAYEQVAGQFGQFAMKKIADRGDIFPVFRELFTKAA